MSNIKTSTLSPEAIKLLDVIKTTDLHESTAIDILFPPPEDYATNKHEYWQRDVNLYKQPRTILLDGVTCVFEPNVEKSLADQTYEYVKELKAAGLIKSYNAGFCYTYIGK